MVIKLKDQWETEQPFNLLSWGHWFTFANLFLALVFSFFYIVEHSLPVTLSGWLYFVTTWLGHFAFLSLSCFIITIFPVIILFPYKRHIRGVSAVMASFFQLYLFLDVLAYRGLGYHLTSSSFNQISEVEDVYVGIMGDSYFVMVLAVYVLILGYQFFASNYTWKKIHVLQNFSKRYVIAGTLIASFFFSHLMHIWADATLNTDIAKQGSMFPAHYPLTAKTLLARYDLLDLEKYNDSKSNRALVNNSIYKVSDTKPVQCDVTSSPNLQVFLLPQNNKLQVEKWLSTNNINYQATNQLSIPKDLNILLFNFTTGLPGLYESAEMDLKVNSHIDSSKISVELSSANFDETSGYRDLAAKKIYVFYDTSKKDIFYRTNALLVGFDRAPDMAFSPQNLVASYLNDVLLCPDYVANNLVDVPLSEINLNNITTNFSEEHFYFVYKDNAILFKKGQLIKNTAYSTDKKVNDSVDIYVLQRAADNLTKRRVKTELN
ncbi:DUF3413 domain-containing protein [Psychrosphaera aestuarii]|uniref:DUF3413 domain-containing protein n=1 Tax=Psychrosphaera aestuarii TaxID=1266052 RepID=UPI001B320760|nr:DUF3413 domain-containing protein [Psychrosphaera aestuarii]